MESEEFGQEIKEYHHSNSKIIDELPQKCKETYFKPSSLESCHFFCQICKEQFKVRDKKSRKSELKAINDYGK